MVTSEGTNVKSAAAKAVDGSHRLVTIPPVALKLALGVPYRKDGDDVLVGYPEGEARGNAPMQLSRCQEVAMSEELFALAAKVAVALRHKYPDLGITRRPIEVVEMAETAQRLVSEEVFLPGLIRVLYFPIMSPASMFYRCVMPCVSMNNGTRVQAFVSKNRVAREAAEFDVVVFQIASDPRDIALAQALQRLGKKVVFELDDAFDALEEWHPGHDAFDRPDQRRNMETMIRLADAVTVSTAPLKERYSRLSSRIQIVPNSVTAVDWPRVDREPHEEFRVLWAGSPSHFGDLALVGSALSSFARAHADVKLVFFGRPPVGLDVPPGQVEFHDYVDFADYPLKLSTLQADVAIAPLADVAFNKYKSNIKLLEYGACSYPIIASSVGPYLDTISNMENGILCGTGEEWGKALEAVRSDLELRTRLGQGARRLALDHDIFKATPAVEKFFVDLVRGE